MKSWGARVAAIYLVILTAAILILPFFISDFAETPNVEHILETPSWQHLLGTDSLGRDLAARLLVGGQVSLLVGVIASLLSLVFGVCYGAVSGWNEGWVDRIFMRFCDILMAIPSFILVSILCLFFKAISPFENDFASVLFSLCFSIAATHWMSLARVSRGIVMEMKRRPFLEAAVALGGSPLHLFIRHIIPHLAGPVLLIMAMQIPTNIIYESFMSFIGLGIQPPQTSWGILVREGWKTLSSYPHLLLVPSGVLFTTVWSLQVLIDSFSKKNSFFE